MDNHRRSSIAIIPKILISEDDIQPESHLIVDNESDPLPLNPVKYLMKMKMKDVRNSGEADYVEGSLADPKQTMTHVPDCVGECRVTTNGGINCDGAEIDDKTLSEKFVEENGSCLHNFHQDENSRKGNYER